MPYDPNKHHRRSIRLKGYDYAQAGAYFVTLCTQHRELLFAPDDVVVMIQRWWDKLPEKFPGVETDAFVIMPNHAHGIIVVGVVPRDDPELGEHVGSPQRTGNVGVNPRVDPDPRDDPGQTHRSAPTSAPTTNNVGVNPRVDPGPRVDPAPTLGAMIQWFKTMTTNEYIHGVKTLNWTPFPGKLWQRNYYEHIIRSEIELNAIRQYIINNPLKWEQDRDNPAVGAIHESPLPDAVETVAAYLSEAEL